MEKRFKVFFFKLYDKLVNRSQLFIFNAGAFHKKNSH